MKDCCSGTFLGALLCSTYDAKSTVFLPFKYWIKTLIYIKAISSQSPLTSFSLKWNINAEVFASSFVYDSVTLIMFFLTQISSSSFSVQANNHI